MRAPTSPLSVLLCLPVLATAQQGDAGATPSTPARGPAAAYGNTPEDLVPYRSSAEPYRRFFLEPFRTYGERKQPVDAATLESIRIGLLAPLEGTDDDPAGKALERGVALALEEASAAGGLDGRPFELVVRNDSALWGSSANMLVDLAYREEVWAVIGSIDSNSTHVALRVALKCEVPIVNVGSTDPTVTETNIPWLVRCTPDDRQTGYALARALFVEEGVRRVAVVRSSDRYGRLGVKEFGDAARRLGHPLPMEVLFRPGEEDVDAILGRVQRSRAQAVVLWGKAQDAGRLVKRMRELGMTQPVFGTDRLVSPEFLARAGAAAEGVTATTWIDPVAERPGWPAFRARFRERFGVEPDVFATYGYEAARMVVEGLQRVGLDRGRLRDALLAVRERGGVAGPMRFDATANNLAPVALVRVRGGRFVRR